MKRILIISLTDHSRDPKVRRQIMLLGDKYEVSAVGLKSAGISGVGFHQIELKPPSLLRSMRRALFYKIGKFEENYWDTYKFDGALEELSGSRFDLIIADKINSLPLAFKTANGAKIIFDAHEYYPGEFEDEPFWKFFLQGQKKYLCRRYMKHCDKVLTVCDSIAREYRRNYGVEPEVITNACHYANLKPAPVDVNHIKMVYHGLADASRKIELVTEVMNHLDDRFSLDLMLVPCQKQEKYLERLEKMAEKKKNTRILRPVPMPEIVNFTNQYDIGIFLCQPNNFNLRYALPNKFFEFIQARLAVAIGPSPEMAKITRKYDCGIVAEDFKPETLAKELNKLTKEKIEHYKKQSDKAAHELTAEKEMSKLNEIITKLLAK